MGFGSFDEVRSFLHACDGKALREWLDPDIPQAAAWSAVDLALLDTFGRVFGRPVFPMVPDILDHVRFSGVIPTGRIAFGVLLAMAFCMAGLRHVKVKVGSADDERILRTIRLILGKEVEIRVDANMAWTLDQALFFMPRLASICVRSFEQQLAPDALDGMAELVHRLGLDVVADESITDRESLKYLMDKKACTSVNIRISKCGGLIAAYNRCQDALQAGLGIQIGCQVGESSLLASAQMALLAQVHHVKYVEGCYGRLLLRQDVAFPSLRFGYAGRPPIPPSGPGLGVTIDEERLLRFCTHAEQVR
jgi:muconate cycloisomerase